VCYLDSKESRLENLYSQLQISNCNTVDGLDKGMLSASLNDQECKLSAGNKRAGQVYSTAYGPNHQANKAVGWLTLSGK
jgi:hypothetical protein